MPHEQPHEATSPTLFWDVLTGLCETCLNRKYEDFLNQRKLLPLIPQSPTPAQVSLGLMESHTWSPCYCDLSTGRLSLADAFSPVLTCRGRCSGSQGRDTARGGTRTQDSDPRASLLITSWLADIS